MDQLEVLLDFESPNRKWVLTFEDDGKVAYGYLKHEGDIVGDVWLYNRCPTPEKPEWSDRQKIPFANSKEYVTENGRVIQTVGSEDVNVDWEDEQGSPVAYIYLFGDLCGVIGVNDKPGYARFAFKDGPLARVMHIESKS